MTANSSFTEDQVQLRQFDVVSVTPTRDPRRLTGSTVVAESVGEARRYLLEAGGWRDQAKVAEVNCQYQLVPRKGFCDDFYGSKSEWIQAVHLGYRPMPVRFRRTGIDPKAD